MYLSKENAAAMDCSNSMLLHRGTKSSFPADSDEETQERHFLSHKYTDYICLIHKVEFVKLTNKIGV